MKEMAIVFYPFPYDEKLETVRQLCAQPQCSNLLHRLFPDHLPDALDLISLAYKPERRFVAGLRKDGQPIAAIKCYLSSEFNRVRLNAKAIRNRRLLRVARPLTKSHRHCVQALEWLDGRLFTELQAAQEAPDTAYLVGQALRELHGQTCNELRQIKPHSEALALRRLASDLGFLAPELAERISDVASRIAQGMAELPQQSQVIHGDFHGRQLIIGHEWIGILDLDDAARGDPLSDLANFSAHLERDRLRGNVSSRWIEEAEQSLWAGYSFTGGQSSRLRLALHKAASLLRLLPHVFRDHEPNWPVKMEQLLSCVEEAAPPMRRQRPVRQRQAILPATDVSVFGTDGVRDDPSMHFLCDAFDPHCVSLEFSARLPWFAEAEQSWHLRKIEVVRHKHGRRCLIQYDLQRASGDAAGDQLSLLGKVRSYGLDKKTFHLQKSLWRAGFGRDAEDCIRVPQAIGCIPYWYMWLQVKVPGQVLDAARFEQGGHKLGRRIVDAIRKLHTAPLLTSRRHTVLDEWTILERSLEDCCVDQPHLRSRIESLSHACQRLAARLEPTAKCGIHRDFYQDHLILDGRKLYLVDLDLYSRGDPALDLGNFLAHVSELSLRTSGHLNRFEDLQQSMLRQIRRLYGRSTARRVEAYTTLSLARHIALSRHFVDRHHLTSLLLEICESRVAT
jgi:aminoglycoside phosphotransferase (APT) family kinase protein